MATISDQLAADIHNAFSRYYTDLANQDQIFFGAGNVTITKQDGTTATVASWAKVQADNAAAVAAVAGRVTPLETNAARKDTANTFAQTQTFTKIATFNAGITAVGEPIAVTKSPGSTNWSRLEFGSLELSHATPFIDFHYGGSTGDFTHRIIASGAETLECSSHFKIDRNLVVNGTAQLDGAVNSFSTFTTRHLDGFIGEPYTDPGGNTGDIVIAPMWQSRFPARGADANGRAMCSLWFEEHVGNNHRAVVRVKGFGAAIQYWHMRNDGQIWNSTRGDVAWSGASDLKLKTAIEHTDGAESLANINALELVKFVYKDDEQARPRRGVIAQQAQLVDPCYVKVSHGSYVVPAANEEPERVETVEKLVLDTNPLLMDTLSAVKYLAGKVEQLEAELAALKAA
ncbi:TPA: tail fiber domain-containing protein [Klebsiella aerogenes]|nr:tail fiber domain-containing protein [Klebsiella aerogenes]